MSSFEEEWRQRFGRYAERHESDHLVSGWSFAGLRQRIGIFERLLDGALLPAGASVLELGCGAGTYVRLVGKRGYPVVGLDYSLPTLSRAVAADGSGVGRYVAGGAYALPFGPGSFRAIICVGVFQALEQPALALAEIARVLQPGGVLLAETLNPRNPVAAVRRIAASVRGGPLRLRYETAARLETLMSRGGIRPVRRVGVLLPPRSVPRLGTVLGQPWMGRVSACIPGVRSVLPHAFWVIGVRQ